MTNAWHHPLRPLDAPRSIHDPITPEQALHLSAFYWNVRPAVEVDPGRYGNAALAALARFNEQYERASAAGRAAILKALDSRFPDPHQLLQHPARPTLSKKHRP